MSVRLLQGAIEEGFIYALVALGLYLSYRILDIADMTTDGTFILGMVTATVFVQKGHPVVGLLMAMVAGALAGFVTALFQTKLGIPSILAGIITMTGLYTVNLVIQGSANVYYKTENTVFQMMSSLIGEKFGVLVVLILIVLLVCVLLVLFFKTQLGLSIRATGDNLGMVQASSINPAFTITVALCMSNSLVALAGALLGQKNRQSDINMGTGVVVIGLASLVLGELFFRKRKVIQGVCAAVLGAILYRIIFTIALRYTPDAGYLKIISAAIIAIVIAAPHVRKELAQSAKRRKGGRNDVTTP